MPKARPPEKHATPEEIRSWVHTQLDLIGANPLMDRFVLLGPGERRRGGVYSSNTLYL